MKTHGLGIVGIILAALALPLSASGQTLSNGNFATGDLAGWSADTVNGGQAVLAKQGTSFSDHPGSDQIPFPEGPGSFAALLRPSGDAESAGILTSNAFVPRTDRLVFYTLSENAAVAPKLFLLAAGADVFNPSVSDLLLVTNVVHNQPGTGPTARFQRQEVSISDEFAAKKAIRIQFRQPAQAGGTTYFTLFSDVDDSGLPPATVPPAAIADLSVTATGPSSATLSFTSPKDTGFGSVGYAASYDVRYGLVPLNEANFDFDSAPTIVGPQPSPAGAKESFDATGLESIQSYFFAVRSYDAAGNRSPISNVANGVTTAPSPGGPGLTAQYYSVAATDPLPPDRVILFTPDRLIKGATRIETIIDTDYEKDRAPGVPHDRFGIRYTGQITPKLDGDYVFCNDADDGTRLWVSADPIDPDNATPIVDRWTHQSQSEVCTDQAMPLKAGTSYHLVEEYLQRDGAAVNHLIWGRNGQPGEIVPPDVLTPTDIPLDPVGRLTGSVFTPDGSPAAGFTVRLTSSSDAATDVTTGESGTYTVLLPSGDYRLSGADLNYRIPSTMPLVTVAPGVLTVAPPVALGPLEVHHLGIVNGNFATGDLTGWIGTGYDGGLVQLEQNGKEYFGEPVPHPDGGDSWAVDVRSWGDPLHLGDTASTGILVSEPFIPNAPTLTFWTHSQNKPVAAKILLIKPTADPIQPKPEDILLQANVRNDNPGMGSGASYEKQTIDLSPFYNAADPSQGTPMRLEARQHTTENSFGWYTLFTDFNAGPTAPLPPRRGDLNSDGQVNIGDAIVGLQVVVGLLPVSPELVALGDVSPKKADGTYGDGVVAVDDVVRILRRVVGLEPDPWP